MARQERDWPTWPVPFSFLREYYDEVVARLWPDIPPWRILDEAAIRSALGEPFQSFEAEDLYPSVPAKAACLFRGLVKNHGLEDGNKRLGVVVTTVFLVINGRLPRYTNSELYLYALRVAARNGNYPVGWIEGWLRRKTRLLAEPRLGDARRQLRRFRESIDDDLVGWINASPPTVRRVRRVQ